MAVKGALLAIDLGDRRTGVAVADTDSGAIMPVEVLDIPRGPRLDAAVAALIEAHAPAALVVGLPLNMDGTEGPRARDTRQWALAIGHRAGIEVHLHDERLTSFEAEDRMRGTSRREKKQRSDALAACVLLESFLDAR
ncbi:MAG: Holliday junction resolvase RuvX [Phycisphaerales bacterium]|nr:Holliday junction resolvase RuvX [Phycisphaerales bacterium]